MSAGALAGEKIRVAAAADLEFVLPQIAAGYEKATGEQVDIVLGSSGNLFAQIESGAPFDVFLSADTEYPQRLVADGMAATDSERVYTVGKLAVLTSTQLQPDFASHGLRALLAPGIRKIAIANPQHAPYGQAAVQALKSAGVYEAAAPKLVLGENVSQTAQFAESGNAEAGLLSLSLLKPHLKAGFAVWEVPVALYPAIQQAGAVVGRSPRAAAAREFLKYLLGHDAQLRLRQYGFGAPQDLP